MDGAITLLLVVGAICLVVVAWAGRKRFPLRIGAGNFFRRKTQVAIVVAGLLIGTAIITSSYVIQSTFDYTVKAAVFRALDAVDEVVFVLSPEGGRLPFSAQVYDNLTTHLSVTPARSTRSPWRTSAGSPKATSARTTWSGKWLLSCRSPRRPRSRRRRPTRSTARPATSIS